MPRLLQERLIPLWELRKHKGIDNLTSDDIRVPPGFVRIANNVDFDAEDMAHRKKGILREIDSGAWHSLWSDEDLLCFGVRSGDLTQINLDWSLTTILSAIGSGRMEFVPVAGIGTFFSSVSVVGYIKDSVAYGFPEVTQTFKSRMVGGHLIEYFDGTFYAAQDNVIVFSDEATPMVTSLKSNIIPVKGPITMMKAVADGMYVSHGGKVFWYGGHGPRDKTPGKVKKLLDVPALPGSAVKVERIDFKHLGVRRGGVAGKVVFFSTVIGIFAGIEGGELVDCTGDNYGVLDIEEGSSLVKWQNGYRQYIFVGQAAPGVGLINLSAVEYPDAASITLPDSFFSGPEVPDAASFIIS